MAVTTFFLFLGELNMFTKTYTQPGYTPPGKTVLDDETYQKVLPVWVKACVDAILYVQPKNHDPRMVIGKRKIQPQKDWWIFGGRILVSDESLQAALSRKLRDEIGLDIPENRIPQYSYLLNMYRWSDDNSVVLAPAFLVEITQKEFSQMLKNVPCSKEYEEIQALIPQEVHGNESFHPALRDCAVALISHLLSKIVRM